MGIDLQSYCIAIYKAPDYTSRPFLTFCNPRLYRIGYSSDTSVSMAVWTHLDWWQRLERTHDMSTTNTLRWSLRECSLVCQPWYFFVIIGTIDCVSIRYIYKRIRAIYMSSPYVLFEMLFHSLPKPSLNSGTLTIHGLFQNLPHLGY